MECAVPPDHSYLVHIWVHFVEHNTRGKGMGRRELVGTSFNHFVLNCLLSKTCNKSSKLSNLQQPQAMHLYFLRKLSYLYQVHFKTNRFGNTFIMKYARHEI